MKSKPKPCCESLYPWLRANLGKDCLAPVTGTDARALTAASHIILLYAYHGEKSLLLAFGHIVRCMQPQTQELAYHAIAHLMDWSDRRTIWLEAGLPEFKPRRCAFEPGGSAWQREEVQHGRVFKCLDW